MEVNGNKGNQSKFARKGTEVKRKKGGGSKSQERRQK